MDPQDDVGLGGSVAIYAVAIAGALAVVMLPVCLANAPAVYKNSGAKTFSEILAARTEGRDYPLAKLERRQIVDPAVVAALNATARTQRARSQVERRPVHHVRHTAAPRTAQQRSYADSTPARGPTPFSLFFSIFR